MFFQKQLNLNHLNSRWIFMKRLYFMSEKRMYSLSESERNYYRKSNFGYFCMLVKLRLELWPSEW